MIISKKFVKVILTVVISLLLIYSILLQIESENYIAKQNQKYNLLKSRNRVSYLPIAIYHIGKLVFDTGANDKKLTSTIYIKFGENLNNGYSSTGFFDEYMIHCFFSNSEKQQLLYGTEENNYR
jgi:hypothetical protein